MDRDRPLDVRILLKFLEADIDGRTLMGALDDLEAVLYQAERVTIDRIAHQSELSPLVRDAALERLRKYRGRRFRLRDVQRGSLGLDLIVTGVAIWVLKNTLGESLKEAWQNSNVHKLFREALKQALDHMAEQILTVLKQSKRRIATTSTTLVLPPRAEVPTLVIEYVPSVKDRLDRVPTISEVLDATEHWE